MAWRNVAGNGRCTHRKLQRQNGFAPSWRGAQLLAVLDKLAVIVILLDNPVGLPDIAGLDRGVPPPPGTANPTTVESLLPIF